MISTKLKKLDSSLFPLIEKRMEWATGFLIVRFKFVHDILSITRRVQSDKTETMGVRCVNGLFDLCYNPHMVGLDDNNRKDIPGLTDEELVWVQTHEVLHMILHHCTMRQFDNHEIGNMAYDLAINQLIPVLLGSCEIPKDENGKVTCLHVEVKDEKGKVIGGLIQKEIFKDIQKKQTSEWYYDYLMKKKKEHGLTIKVGKKNKDGSYQVTISDSKGNSISTTMQVDDHSGWKEDEVADERVRAKVLEIDRRDGWNNAWGSETAGIVEMVRAAQRRRINWHNHIRQFYGNQVWTGRETTRKRPNRRTGFVHPGFKKIQVARHLLGVDASCSIDSILLSGFLGVMNQMTDYIPIDLVVFDWEKQEGPIPYDKKRTMFNFKGRGGTNFQPLIDIAEKYRYRSLVILTDGAAAAPVKPKNCRVLWVLPEGCNPPVDWGQRVYMTRH